MATIIPFDQLSERYSFLDPGGGKKDGMKKQRARSAIVTIAVDGIGRVFVVHTWASHAKTSEIVEKIFEVNEKFRPTLFGIESSGQQSLFVDQVEAEAARRRIRLPLKSHSQPLNQNKEFRIRQAIEPVISSGRLFLQEEDVELHSELLVFPTGRLKDMADALASAITIAPERIRKRNDDGKMARDVDLEQYLRSRGFPEHEIEKRVKASNPRYAA